MKLYTEEQVHKIIELAEFGRHITYGELLDEFTPIELPSDEEIREKAIGLFNYHSYRAFFGDGAKWMRDEIINQNK